MDIDCMQTRAVAIWCWPVRQLPESMWHQFMLSIVFFMNPISGAAVWGDIPSFQSMYEWPKLHSHTCRRDNAQHTHVCLSFISSYQISTFSMCNVQKTRLFIQFKTVSLVPLHNTDCFVRKCCITHITESKSGKNLEMVHYYVHKSLWLE
jgi:hypothetical protein